VEIISLWQNDESGNAVAALFEVFPGSYSGRTPRWSNINKTSEYDATTRADHYYQKVANVCQFNAAPAGAWPRADAANDAANLAGHQNPGLPGNPFLAVSICKKDGAEGHSARDALDYMDKALSVNPLKNVASIFINIGAKFGGNELIKKSHLSAIQIYRNLLNYIKYSSLAMGMIHHAPTHKASPSGAVVGISTAPLYNMGLQAPARVSGADATYKNAADIAELAPTGAAALTNGLLSGAPAVVGVAGLTQDQIRANVIQQVGANAAEGRVAYESAVALAAVGKAARDSAMENMEFAETDKLFQMCIKSMVAKVLTAIGVFNMFKRPINEDGLGFFSGLRLVLGGAGGSATPQVIPEALELYVRLPLLAEF
jgi:hypothetical protein